MIWRSRLKTDWILFVTVLVMVLFGVLIVYSASSMMAQMDPRYHSAWYFVQRQAAWAVIALAVMMVLKNTHYRKLQNPAVALQRDRRRAVPAGGGLLPRSGAITAGCASGSGGPAALGVGQAGAGGLPGVLRHLARARHQQSALHAGAGGDGGGLVILAVVVADLGTAVVLGAAAAVVFFVAGLEWRYCAIVGALAMIGLVFFVFSKTYRLARVVQFFDPQFKIIEKFDQAGHDQGATAGIAGHARHQLSVASSRRSRSAPAASLGLGLMSGRQKLLYLPEAHTDFIYAVVGEELGMIGSVGLLVGFVIIFWRGLRATLRMQRRFRALSGAGADGDGRGAGLHAT